MHAVHILGLIAGFAFMSATCAQTSSREDENRYTRPPYQPKTERDYEPWRSNRESKPAKPTATPKTPKTQAVTTTTKPEPRDPALARCDEYKRRMEKVIREEQRGGDPAHMKRLGEERKKVYQDTLRAGC